MNTNRHNLVKIECQKSYIDCTIATRWSLRVIQGLSGRFRKSTQNVLLSLVLHAARKKLTESSYIIPVMDFTYPLTRCMSQHMPILGLLGLNSDSLVFSITFCYFLDSSYQYQNIMEHCRIILTQTFPQYINSQINCIRILLNLISLLFDVHLTV